MKTKRNKLVFIDIDGTQYYQDSSGEIINNAGELVSLTEEDNVRAFTRLVDLKIKLESGTGAQRNN